MSEQKDFIITKGVLEKYTGPGGAVEIPAEVTVIGKGAFAGNEDLTAVTSRRASRGSKGSTSGPTSPARS